MTGYGLIKGPKGDPGEQGEAGTPARTLIQSDSVTDVSSFTISNLNGDSDEIYQLVLDMTITPGGAERALHLLPNNNATPTRQWSHHHTGNWGGAVNSCNVNFTAQLMGIMYVANYTTIKARIESIIYAKTGDNREVSSKVNQRYPLDRFSDQQTKGQWQNTIDNITSLVVALYNGGTMTGTWKLYKLN